MTSPLYTARDIRLFGIVQGVGMRPTIWRIAHAHQIGGWVQNGVGGVLIHAVASNEQLDEFEKALLAGMPVRAQIEKTEVSPSTVTAGDLLKNGELKPFAITKSNTDTSAATQVSFDIATCDTCISELFDPSDRRYHYPFINCTDCGPRFTIINDLPYDRHTTSMGAFPMCPTCDAEYHDPATRRFDAQPDACFLCGPQISYHTHDQRVLNVSGTTVEQRRLTSDAIIDHCVSRLHAGAIVAVKGLGGFHLVVDAANEEAVMRLRKRKRRSRKALAIMVPSLDWAHRIACINQAEEDELTSCRRPIVLLAKRTAERSTHLVALTHTTSQAAPKPEKVLQTDLTPKPMALSSYQLAPSVTGHLPEVGIMLPYTPLHHLLLAAFGKPLVMTSGNISGEPICATNDEALSQLSSIADDFLLHDRAIVTRFDDSVVRIVNGHTQLIRRARGYAPLPLALDSRLHANVCIGTTGAEQKDTCALSSGVQVYLSQHLGDLERPGILNLFAQVQMDMGRLFRIDPKLWAHDGHPAYLSTQWARRHADQHHLPRCVVQHHHAHIASVLGEHQIVKPVIGLALDGTGYAQEPAAMLEYTPSSWAITNAAEMSPTRSQTHQQMLCDDQTDNTNDSPYVQATTQNTSVTHVLDHAKLIQADKRLQAAHHELIRMVYDAQVQQTFDSAGFADPSVSFDTDRTKLWGGEIFLSTPSASVRLATLQSLALVGGQRAIQHPWRIAYAWLLRAGLTNHPGAQRFIDQINQEHNHERSVMDTMLHKQLNTVYSSSAGRLLDAISALLHICPVATYEGEPAILLEAALCQLPEQIKANPDGSTPTILAPNALKNRGIQGVNEHNLQTQNLSAHNDMQQTPSADAHSSKAAAYSHNIFFDARYLLTPTLALQATSHASTHPQMPLVILNHTALLSAILDDLAHDVPSAIIAARVHEGLAQSLCREVIRMGGVYSIDTCAYAGGVFMNKTISRRVSDLLIAAGMTPITNRDLPVNDGSIAYGQAVAAHAALAQTSEVREGDSCV